MAAAAGTRAAAPAAVSSTSSAAKAAGDAMPARAHLADQLDVGWDRSFEAALDALAAESGLVEPGRPSLSRAELAATEGNLLMGRHQFAEAISTYSKGLAEAPGDRLLLANRSAAHFALGTAAGMEAAQVDAEACTRTAPGWPRGWMRLGIAQRGLGRFAAAEMSLIRGRALVIADGEAAAPTAATAGGAGAAAGAAPSSAALLDYFSACSAILGGLASGPAPPYPASIDTAAAGRGSGGGSGAAAGGQVVDLTAAPTPADRAVLLHEFDAALEELAKTRVYEGEIVEAAAASGTADHDARLAGEVAALSLSAAHGAGGAGDTAAAGASTVETKESRLEGEATTAVDGAGDESDKFAALESWLLSRSTSSFPALFMRRYGEGNRGVHARVDVGPESEVMAIGREFLITVEMGRHACPLGRALAAAGIDRELSAAKHCYLALFVLWDRRNPSSFYQPYYRILPSTYPNIPVFWGDDELSHLRGSYLQQQVSERVENLRADYAAILEVVPSLATLATYEDFAWARMMVASRNFGIMVDGVRTDALVPYADMLNHQRPRQTRWAFDNKRQAFLIHSLVKLHVGQQVYDSYGKKCNSRFLLNYGFAVEYNRDDDTGQNHNELRLILRSQPPHEDACYHQRMRLIGEHHAGDDWGVAYGHPALRTSAGHGAELTRAVRVSTHAESEGTAEAFTFLRFAHARSGELAILPRLGSSGEADFARRPIGPLSVETELVVLRHLAAACAEQLATYPTTLEDDIRLLASGTLAYGSNRRNSVVLVKGEKEICRYYQRLATEAEAAAAMPWLTARDALPAKYAGTSDLDKYMRNVILRLLRRAAEDAATAAAAAAAASGAVTPLVAAVGGSGGASATVELPLGSFVTRGTTAGLHRSASAGAAAGSGGGAV